jgi:hypothetical protein
MYMVDFCFAGFAYLALFIILIILIKELFCCVPTVLIMVNTGGEY